MSRVSVRSLNRTLLDRQFLAERTGRSTHEVIRHLVAVQGQEPNWPYVGLWSRVQDFRHDDLATLLQDHQVVRSTMVRRTMHLADAADFRWLRPTVRPIVDVALTHAYNADEIDGLDRAELAEVGHRLLLGRALTRRELGQRLAEHFAGRHERRLADAVELLVPLVHSPSAAAWGRWGNPSGISVALAEDRIDGAMSTGAQLETMVRRYLAAFGPATVMDVQAWSGLTRLREIVEHMDLRVLASEDGVTLYDLPGASVSEAERAVPVRFLPAFDNALLGHRDRRRMISDDDRRRFARIASGGVPMFLVDGFVQGVWSITGSTLVVSPFRPPARADRDAVEAEAARLAAFVAPGASVTFVEDGELPVNRLQPSAGS